LSQQVLYVTFSICLCPRDSRLTLSSGLGSSSSSSVFSGSIAEVIMIRAEDDPYFGGSITVLDLTLLALCVSSSSSSANPTSMAHRFTSITSITPSTSKPFSNSHFCNTVNVLFSK
ncbi:hypothetical protein M758_UG068100, partial [Ceratodon purpureus]